MTDQPPSNPLEELGHAAREHMRGTTPPQYQPQPACDYQAAAPVPAYDYPQPSTVRWVAFTCGLVLGFVFCLLLYFAGLLPQSWSFAFFIKW
jgi:hypothetical protein